MNRRIVLGVALGCAAWVVPFAHEREDRTLLNHDQMRAIVNLVKRP